MGSQPASPRHHSCPVSTGAGPLMAFALHLAASCVCSSDSLGWKLFYVTGCLFVAVQNLEDWEVRSAQARALRCFCSGLPHVGITADGEALRPELLA